MNTFELAVEADSLGVQVQGLRRELREVRAAVAEAQAEVVETREIALLQEAGIYQYAHPLSNAVGYKDLLARVRSTRKRW